MLGEQYYSNNFKQHEFIAAKRKTTISWKGDTILPRKKKLISKIKSCRTDEHPCHLKTWEKTMLGHVEIPRAERGLHCAKGRFLPVQTGHYSNIEIDISVVARDGYIWKYKTTVRHQLSAYPDRLVFMRFIGIFQFFPLSARKQSWKYGFIVVT